MPAARLCADYLSCYANKCAARVLGELRTKIPPVVSDKPPLVGRLIGWLLVVVALTVAARVVWELLWPLLPVLVGMLGLGAVYMVIARRPR